MDANEIITREYDFSFLSRKEQKSIFVEMELVNCSHLREI